MDKKSDIARFLAPALFVLNKAGTKLDKHKLFKILYFADKEHVSKYGRTLMGDNYIAMANGPVPSRLFDYIRVLEGKSFMPVTEEFKNELAGYLWVEAPYYVVGLQNADTDFLSKNAIRFLLNSIENNISKNFDQLTVESHDAAWKAAEGNSEMSVTEIAKAAGVKDEMIRYIESM